MKIKDMTKQELINNIMTNLRENEYDSRDAVWDMAESYLGTMSKKDLLGSYFADVMEEEI
jgi:hypothetical protein